MLKRGGGFRYNLGYLSMRALESRLPVHLIGQVIPQIAHVKRDALALERPDRVRR